MSRTSSGDTDMLINKHKNRHSAVRVRTMIRQIPSHSFQVQNFMHVEIGFMCFLMMIKVSDDKQFAIRFYETDEPITRLIIRGKIVDLIRNWFRLVARHSDQSKNFLVMRTLQSHDRRFYCRLKRFVKNSRRDAIQEMHCEIKRDVVDRHWIQGDSDQS